MEEHTQLLAKERATCDRQSKGLDSARRAAERDRDQTRAIGERTERDAVGRVEALSTALAERDRAARGETAPKADGPELQALRDRLARIGEAVAVVGTTVIVTMSSDELFGSPGGRALSGAGHERLEALGRELVAKSAGPDRAVEVHAHADDGSSDEAARSFEMTSARALEVLGALLRAGLPPSRITLIAHGRYRPKDVAPTEDARSSNRRIELWVE